MSKKSWCTWAFTGIFGLTVAGAGVASNNRPDQVPGTLTTAATGPARAVVPNSSTNVNQLLKAYGIVRLPAVKPATETHATAIQPAENTQAPQPAARPVEAADSAVAAVATDLPAEIDARYQITRLPAVESQALPGLSDPATAIPVPAPTEQFNSNIIRTGRFEPTDASTVRQSEPTTARDASSLGWYEVGVNSRRTERSAEAAPRSAPPSPDQEREEVSDRVARRDGSRTILQSPAPRRYTEDEVASRQEPRRAETTVHSARPAEDYEEPRSQASRYEQDRLRPAPVRQRYTPASYSQRTGEPAELSNGPSSRSVRPDDVASAVTSRREMLMVDEDRFNAAARQGSYDPAWQPGGHATMARYRVEEHAASPAYQGAEGIVYPPGGPNLVYGGGPDNCCGPLCDPCACSCGWMWVFGTEATMFKTNRNGVDASVELITPTDRILADADDNLAMGPRLWFGARSCKWEVLGRLWIVGDVFDDTDPLRFGTDDRTGIFQGSNLEAYTADAEIVRHFCCGPCWDIYAGVGFRYASLEQVARVSGTINDTQLPAGFGYADAIAYNQIDGPGITAVFGGSRLLHCYCHSSLNAFWIARGSMIWGDIDATAQTTVLALDTVGPAAAGRIDAAYANTDGDMIIGEVQVGLRWCHPLRCMPAVASVHVAFETQWWDADGGFAFAEGAAIANNIGAGALAASGPNSELSLIGLNAGCGLTF